VGRVRSEGQLAVRMLHIAGGKLAERLWSPLFRQALAPLGELCLIEDGGQQPEHRVLEHLRSADVLLTGWESVPIPEALAEDPGRVRYICHVTGTLRGTVPLRVIESGIPVSNWGDAPAHGVAEGAMCLLLASLKDLHAHIAAKRSGLWGLDMHTHGGSLRGLRVGVYGCGAIGRKFVELLRPFGATITVYDPYIPDVPDGCQRAESLEELFDGIEALVIHAGLSAETRGSVTAELLARLPDHGVVVNTARGAIIDQAALFAELESGRLRAGLDVLEPDTLPPDHPARQWDSLILTSHQIEWEWPDGHRPPTRLLPMHEVCLGNLRRFRSGQPILHRMDMERYLRST